ncbi:FkbM family methyltransferase [bacterium]|nr:FkbM family methyltransferase [bacterium]
MSDPSQVTSPTLAVILRATEAAARLLASEGATEEGSSESAVHHMARSLNEVLRYAGIRLITTQGYKKLLASSGDSFGHLSASETLKDVLSHVDAYDALRSRFADDSSRAIFDWCLAMRVAFAQVGGASLTLFPAPVSMKDYDKHLAELARQRRGRVYDVAGLRVESSPEAIADSVVLEQYLLPGLVEPRSGETVLDVGAFMGETSLWFARKVGSSGKVIAFEPVPSLARKCLENVHRNAGQALPEIRIENIAVGARSGSCMMTERGDSGDAVIDTSTGDLAMVSIDDYVCTSGMGRVDFIKMDIEGMERYALEGAGLTIRRYHPKLAISCYHKGDDLRVLAGMICKQVPEYRLYLSHKSPTWHETVLFACCDARQVTSDG